MLADIASHPNSVGFPENHPPMKTFLRMSIRHLGEHLVEMAVFASTTAKIRDNYAGMESP